MLASMALSDCRDITSCDQDLEWGLAIASGDPGPGLLPHSWLRILVAFGKGLPFQNIGVADPHRVCKGVGIPIGQKFWFWDTLDFHTSWYWFFTTMMLCYHHQHPFLCKSSKHSKAQVLHPMKTTIKPRARIRSVTCNSMCTSTISLLCNSKLDSLALW